MRLHTLDLAAFGPFAQPAHIDFDELGADGLFLIAGPTGAGKTTILDAVSFALYGRVPGQRNDAHELRTKGVPADRETRVALTFTARGHTYRVERVPAYERPALRGGGTTVQRAAAVLFEHRDGDWAGLSRTNQEVSRLVAEAIGLSADQFTKIIMLPQGQFAQFLKAGPQEREPILQQLFDTARFSRVERILAEDATRARARVGEIGHERTAAVADALSAAGLSVDALPLPGVPSAGDVLAGFAVALDELRQRSEIREAAVARTRSIVRSAERDVQAAEGRSADAQRLAALRAVEERIRANADAVAAAQAQVSRHESALAVFPALSEHERALERARSAATALQERTGEARAAADAVGARTEPESLAGDAAADRALDAWRRAQSAAAELARDLTAAAALRTRIAAATESMSAGTAAHDAARERLERGTTALSELEPAGLAEERIAQHTRIAAEAQDAAAAAARLVAARDRAADALTAAQADEDCAARREEEDRALYDRTRELRLDALAAELAGLLEPGSPCPVCGATDHPHPAAASPSDVTKEAERRARDAWQAGARALRSASEARAGAAAALTQAEAAAVAADPEGTAAAATAARARLRSLQDEQTALTRERERLAAEVQEARGALAAAESALETARAEHAEAAAGLGALEGTSLSRNTEAVAALALPVPTAPDAAEALASGLNRLVGAGRAAQSAARTDEAARRELEARARDLRAALADSPFPDVAAARDEIAADVTAAGEAVAAAREDRIRAAQLAEDPAIARAQASPATREDLEERLADARAQRAGAAQRAQACASAAAVTADALRRVVERRDAFLAAVASSERALADDIRRVEIAGLVQATSPENVKRMSLSSYALLAQFVQVTENASDRLAAMTSGRYRLVHDVSLHKREKRAGLGLLVADDFTQSLRDPRTLSGGESFMAALALALGLADTVAGSRGGIELDTLFIDEGFGSLDPDALAEVLTVLDDLRAGGRTVGIISHVASMHDAIPSRLVVSPSPAGSTLSVALVG